MTGATIKSGAVPPDLRTVRQAVDAAVMPRLKAIYERVLTEYAADLSATADTAARARLSAAAQAEFERRAITEVMRLRANMTRLVRKHPNYVEPESRGGH